MKAPLKYRKPFYSDAKISITVNVDKENKISDFKVNSTIVKVKNFGILEAWKQVEKLIAKANTK